MVRSVSLRHEPRRLRIDTEDSSGSVYSCSTCNVVAPADPTSVHLPWSVIAEEPREIGICIAVNAKATDPSPCGLPTTSSRSSDRSGPAAAIQVSPAMRAVTSSFCATSA